MQHPIKTIAFAFLIGLGFLLAASILPSALRNFDSTEWLLTVAFAACTVLAALAQVYMNTQKLRTSRSATNNAK